MLRSFRDHPIDFRQDLGCMTESSDILNSESRPGVSISVNDLRRPHSQSRVVSDTTEPDWHLQEWMTYFEKKQASLTNELGWNKGRANHIYHGKQKYNRDLVNEVTQWLGIEPYELLMQPEAALQLRALRDSALAIAASVKSKA